MEYGYILKVQDIKKLLEFLEFCEECMVEIWVQSDNIFFLDRKGKVDFTAIT